MFNSTGITKVAGTNTTQILANVDIQASMGCVVPQSLGVSENGLTIAKAGTPVKYDPLNMQAPVVAADGTNAMNGVLLHDVDVTAGANNGAVLLLGFVNINRIDTATQALLTTAAANAAASKLITVVKA